MDYRALFGMLFLVNIQIKDRFMPPETPYISNMDVVLAVSDIPIIFIYIETRIARLKLWRTGFYVPSTPREDPPTRRVDHAWRTLPNC